MSLSKRSLRVGDVRVSIVIPAYNAEAYLDRTLSSARAQTHRALEILVIDDGSSDGTRALAEVHALQDARIRVIATQNQGVAAARNRGISEATGEYVAFLDADDLWHPTKIEKQLAALHRKPETWAAAYAYFRTIDADDAILGSSAATGPSGYIFGRHLCLRFVGNGSSLLVRRSAALALGGFDAAYAANGIGGCEDFDYELRIAEKYHVACVPEWLVGYRVYDGNMSSNRARMGRSLLAVLDRCFSRNPGLHPFIRRHAVAESHFYAARNFLRARHFREATASAATVALNDLGAFLGLLDTYRLAAWVRLQRALAGTRGSPDPGGAAFLQCDPAQVLTPLDTDRRKAALSRRCEALDNERAKSL